MPSPSTPQTIPVTTEDSQTTTGSGFESRVIVFNCDCHTYQQVVDLFCRFIPGMTPTKAFDLAYQIDHEGEATVYVGSMEQAEDIAAKLTGGGLRVIVH